MSSTVHFAEKKLDVMTSHDTITSISTRFSKRCCQNRRRGLKQFIFPTFARRFARGKGPRSIPLCLADPNIRSPLSIKLTSSIEDQLGGLSVVACSVYLTGIISSTVALGVPGKLSYSICSVLYAGVGAFHIILMIAW